MEIHNRGAMRIDATRHDALRRTALTSDVNKCYNVPQLSNYLTFLHRVSSDSGLLFSPYGEQISLRYV